MRLSYARVATLVILCAMGSAARAVTAVSNLANTQTGAASIDSSQFGVATAGRFDVGASSQTLAGATIQIDSIINPFADFSLAVYTDTGLNPGSSIVTLTGAIPTSAGDWSFTDPSGTTLLANTRYWLVASSTNGLGTWATTTDPTEVSPLGWQIANTLSQRSNFNGFWQTSGSSVPMFSVEVQPVPEPMCGTLLVVGTAIALKRRRGAGN